MMHNNKIRVIEGLVLVVLLVALTGCSLIKAGGEIFDEDDEMISSKSPYHGALLDYSKTAKNKSSITLREFLTDRLFSIEGATISSNNIECQDNSRMFYFDSNGDKRNFTSKTKTSYSNKIYKPVTIDVSDVSLFATIRAYGMPNHETNYYLNNNESNVCNSNFKFGNAQVVTSGNLQEVIMMFPVKTEVTFPTQLKDGDVVGVALTGVEIIVTTNIGDEKKGLDRHFGKPNKDGVYKYYAVPEVLYKDKKDGLVGIAKDGFPIFGPHEQDEKKAPIDLDDCHGHVGNAGAFQISYHYHIPVNIAEKTDKYIIGCFSGVL